MPRQVPDRDAWLTGVLDRFERPLMRYAVRRIGDLETARDVVQESFLRLCRQVPAPEGAHLSAWLYRVCRNLAIDHLRKESRMKTLEQPERAVDPQSNGKPASRAEARDERSRLRTEIAALPARQQEVVRLRFQEGLSYRQIAVVTDASTSHVGVLLHAAMKTLKKRMAVDAVAPTTCGRRSP